MKLPFLSKVILLYIASVVVAACDSCGGFFLFDNTDGPSKYNIIDYTSYSVKATTNTSGKYFDPYVEHLNDGATLPWDDFGIFINTEKDYISQVQNGSAFTSAFACSPAPPVAVQKISEFTITSDNIFTTASKTFAVGESLNELFDLEDQASIDVDATLIGNEHPEVIMLTLKTPPVSNQVHLFHIEIALDNGGNFAVNTARVELQTH